MDSQNQDLLRLTADLKKEKLDLVLEVKAMTEERNQFSIENMELKKKLAGKDEDVNELNKDVLELKGLLAKLIEVKSSLNKYFDNYYHNFTDKEKEILRENNKGEAVIEEEQPEQESKSKPNKAEEDFWYSQPYS